VREAPWRRVVPAERAGRLPGDEVVQLDDYADRFSVAAVERDDAGVLTIRLHSKGEPLWWGGRPHRELPELFAAVAADRKTRVVVLTGTGDRFIELRQSPALRDLPEGKVVPARWDQTLFEGLRLIEQFLAIEVPVIAAVNGPVTVHSELAVLADVVLATHDTFFQDDAHFTRDLVPGDGVHVVWPMLLGPNRGRSFLLTGAKLDAAEAQRLGVVAEVLDRSELMDRAYELAHRLAACNPLLLRNTRHLLVRPIRRAVHDELHLGLSLEALTSLSGAQWFADDDQP